LDVIPQGQQKLALPVFANNGESFMKNLLLIAIAAISLGLATAAAHADNLGAATQQQQQGALYGGGG
jgi:hypothetical protein